MIVIITNAMIIITIIIILIIERRSSKIRPCAISPRSKDPANIHYVYNVYKYI